MLVILDTDACMHNEDAVCCFRRQFAVDCHCSISPWQECYFVVASLYCVGSGKVHPDVTVFMVYVFSLTCSAVLATGRANQRGGCEHRAGDVLC